MCVNVTDSLTAFVSVSARTVTARAVFQALGPMPRPKINHSVSTDVACPAACSATSALSLRTSTTTSPAGCVANRTLYAVDDPSVTARLLTLSVRSGSSSSVTWTVTDATVTPMYSDAPVRVCVSITRSSTAFRSDVAVAVTVCAVAQFIVVNVSSRVPGVKSVSTATAALLRVTVSITVPVGTVFNTTVYVALAVDGTSSVSGPSIVGLTVTPGCCAAAGTATPAVMNSPTASPSSRRHGARIPGPTLFAIVIFALQETLRIHLTR